MHKQQSLLPKPSNCSDPILVTPPMLLRVANAMLGRKHVRSLKRKLMRHLASSRRHSRRRSRPGTAVVNLQIVTSHFSKHSPQHRRLLQHEWEWEKRPQDRLALSKPSTPELTPAA
jgi:hypothetical protein